MKKTVLFLLLMVASVGAFAQNRDWAIGGKIGEPSGLSLRNYLRNDKNAIEINFGVYGGIWGVRDSYKTGAFNGSGIAVSGLYLWHNEMGSSRFKNYYGFGGQITSRKYFVDDTFNGIPYKKEIPATGLGGVGSAGLEYFSPDSPLSIFMEVGAYVELVPSVFYFHPQAGIGARLNF
ncbi:hypothetical protein [Flectobacillus roseus]|uniref:Outer membrane protein beta-barrel domain-containing protein n=1 Tax=Flectobacillus roseus TaxID=502259 RepID=A0ABT6Y237_9BACT|nr:hypothetical protein [Flectobacillus roseus]MDI9857630.1 hypothetical protein [Flectobacillus roseus]